MLHEILFALLGRSGNVIIETENKFEINPLITFLSSSEKDLLNKLIILGFFYKNIEKFLKDTSESFCQTSCFVSNKLIDYDIQEFTFGTSIYLKALTSSLDEILKEYRDSVLSVEQKYLKNRVYTISLLNIHLNKYFILLPEINLLVKNKIYYYF